jgi:hypothetical protein
MAIQAAEKPFSRMFCTKGTASAGPTKPNRNQPGFSPCGMSAVKQKWSLSAACYIAETILWAISQKELLLLRGVSWLTAEYSRIS